MQQRNNFVVYKITNTVDNKIYVGSAVYFAGRKGEHLSNLRRNTHHNKYLQNAFNKYGENSFKFDVIEKDRTKDLVEAEQFWIDTLLPEYNFLKVAYSSIGMKHTEEVKQHLSNIFKGSQRSLGRQLSDLTKKKIGEHQIGRIKSEEEKNIKRKAVVQLNLKGELLSEFIDSVTAAKELGLADANIRCCCGVFKGKRKYPYTVGGFKFAHKEDWIKLQNIKEGR